MLRIALREAIDKGKGFREKADLDKPKRNRETPILTRVRRS